jgi:predicted AlkP superfamily pyrophosphatase or phosphodiesterase
VHFSFERFRWKPVNARMFRILKFLFLVMAIVPLGFGSTNDHVVLITIDGLPAYLMEDTNAPLRTLRKLAQEGTVAEGMTVSNPSVTWPNHTTLVTGVEPAKHHVLFNGVLVRGEAGVPAKVDPRRDKSELVAVPTINDYLHSLGYRTADVNWPCTRNAKTLDWSFPDVPEQVTQMTASLRAEAVGAGILVDATDKTFLALSGPAKDQVWTATACHVIEKHKPNLLLFHLLVTDSTHHKYGPQSPAGYVAVGLADAHVNQLIESLRRAGILERTTIIVTSDHGFARATNLLNPNVLFRKAGLLEADNSGVITKARAHIISEGGTALVYLTDPKTKEDDSRKVLKLLRSQPEISEILEAKDFARFGYPDPEKFAGMSDFVLIPKEGSAFANTTTGDEFVTMITPEMNQGFHGFISTNPKMDATFVAWGRGIKKGEKIGMVKNIDVAPTLAALLGETLPNTDGKVLKEILAP